MKLHQLHRINSKCLKIIMQESMPMRNPNLGDEEKYKECLIFLDKILSNPRTFLTYCKVNSHYAKIAAMVETLDLPRLHFSTNYSKPGTINISVVFNSDLKNHVVGTFGMPIMFLDTTGNLLYDNTNSSQLMSEKSEELKHKMLNFIMSKDEYSGSMFGKSEEYNVISTANLKKNHSSSSSKKSCSAVY